MIEGRYELNWIDLSGTESTYMRHNEASVLVALRDVKLAEDAGKSITYRVLDSEDYERGDIDWCDECEGSGKFDRGTACAYCEGSGVRGNGGTRG